MSDIHIESVNGTGTDKNNTFKPSNDYSLESVSSTSTNEIYPSRECIIRVVGVGGGGCNTVQHMINQSLSGVEFIAVNTDAQALARSTAHKTVQIGVKLTNGLGAGCDPHIGRKAAEESKEDIKKLLLNSNMVFVTAGMGGGTGTGAAPIVAQLAKEAGAVTVGVVTKPFKFEGKQHMVNALAGITELSKNVDSIIVIENDNLLRNLGANISIINAFNEANDVLYNAVRGITDAIRSTGIINLDFNDVKFIMQSRGDSMIGTGMGQGANFIEDAVQKAIHSPLIEQVDITAAQGLLVSARVNPNFPITKWQEISDAIQSYATEDADCKFGLIFDDKLAEDQIGITILITGISNNNNPNNIEGPANIARAQSSIRRNTMGPDGREGGIFGMAQGMQSPMSSQVNQGQRMGQPQGNMQMQQGNGNVNPFGPMASSSVCPMDNDKQVASEVQITSPMSSTDNNQSDLWEVPAILRNKAD